MGRRGEKDGKVVKDRWKERGGGGKIEKRGVTELELTRKAQSPGVQGKRPPLNPHTYQPNGTDDGDTTNHNE